MIEKENKKYRDTAKREYNETLRALVTFARRLDKRVMLFEKERSQKRAEDEIKAAALK